MARSDKPRGLREDLERDSAAEALLARQVDVSHAAAPELALDLIAGENGAPRCAPVGDVADQLVRLLDAVAQIGSVLQNLVEVGLAPFEHFLQELVEQVGDDLVVAGRWLWRGHVRSAALNSPRASSCR